MKNQKELDEKYTEIHEMVSVIMGSLDTIFKETDELNDFNFSLIIYNEHYGSISTTSEIKETIKNLKFMINLHEENEHHKPPQPYQQINH